MVSVVRSGSIIRPTVPTISVPITIAIAPWSRTLRVRRLSSSTARFVAVVGGANKKHTVFVLEAVGLADGLIARLHIVKLDKALLGMSR